MIKLNNILNEAHNYDDISKPISKNDALSILSKYYDDDYIHHKYTGRYEIGFFKGIYVDDDTNISDFLYIDTPKLLRTSADFRMNNIYNLLFSEILPSWKEYPKRNKSIVGASTIERASDYGPIYRVFPLDKSPKIGMTSRSDLWYSFQRANCINLHDFEMDLTMAFQKNNLKYNSANQIEESIKKLNKHHFQNMNLDDKFFRIYANSNDNINLFDYLNDKLSPEHNSFKLLNSIYNIPNINAELWTESKCILMRIEYD